MLMALLADMQGPFVQRLSAHANFEMKTLIVSVAKAGHVNQCIAICEAGGWNPDETVRIPAPGRMTPAWESFSLNVRRKLAEWRSRPRRREPGPLRIVASGFAAEPVVAAYRALYGDDLFAAFSGRPRSAERIFDVALVPRHSLTEEEAAKGFSTAAAKRSVLRRGVPTRRVARSASVAPCGTLAMIGGVNKAYEIDQARIVDQVRNLRDRGRPGPFWIAFSRRTPSSTESYVRSALGSSDFTYIDRLDRPQFEHAMASAAEFIVTPDSLTMVCEACAMSRPVLLFDLACFDPDATTARCIRDLIEGGEVALAPHGAPQPAKPGIFAIPREVLAAYEGWKARLSTPIEA